MDIKTYTVTTIDLVLVNMPKNLSFLETNIIMGGRGSFVQTKTSENNNKNQQELVQCFQEGTIEKNQMNSQKQIQLNNSIIHTCTLDI